MVSESIVSQTENYPNNDCGDQIDVPQCDGEVNKGLTRIYCGDLYIIGQLWIEALKTLLLGFKITLIPVVSAASKKECPPQKPPPMKYTDLPLYKSPHYEYKDYIEDKKKCPKAKVRILHQHLLPKVKCWRREFQKASCEAKCNLIKSYCHFSSCVSNAKRDFKKKMRDPDNLSVRQAVVLAGGATGFLLGSGKGIPRRFFFTSAGLLSTGALCFPKETDAAFREFAYHSGKMVLGFYNGMCGKQLSLRERMPCKEDLPPQPPPRKSQCPPKKK